MRSCKASHITDEFDLTLRVNLQLFTHVTKVKSPLRQDGESLRVQCDTCSCMRAAAFDICTALLFPSLRIYQFVYARIRFLAFSARHNIMLEIYRY